MPTASKIEEFLRNVPPGRLYVVVGYADVTWLAWLGRHAAERPVILLIGDTRGRLFQGQPQDRRAALDLLARADVNVLSGYRRGAPLVHQKVFVVASPGGDQAVAGLAGSANLTEAGLFRNEETVVRVAREELLAVWRQTRATCARGRPAGERIAGYIRDAAGEQRQASGRTTSGPNDRAARTSPRRPAPGGSRSGGGRLPAQRRGGGRGSRRTTLAGLGIALVGVLLVAGLCTAIRDRLEPGTEPAAITASPSTTLAEVPEQPHRPGAPPTNSSVSDQSEQPNPATGESDPQTVPPPTVSESGPSLEEPDRDENDAAAIDESDTETAPGGVEGVGDRRDGELDDAVVAALSVVVAAARSVYEAEGGFAGAGVAVLEGMGLTVPATVELVEATGEENVALSFFTHPAVTPWVVSVLAPSPGESGAQAVWAVAVRSPAACRAVVLDPDLGAWAGTTSSGYCSGADARNSYVNLRGVGGQRGHYQWAPATPERMTVDPAGVEGVGDGRAGELDDAAVTALSVVVAAARSVYEAEGGFAGAGVVALEGMGLTIRATAELAEATGEENVALMFVTHPAVTPWVVSVLAPSPGDSGAEAVWAVAVRSSVACRAVVLDPDLGAWAGTTSSGYCSGADARNSYVNLRGVGGQRGHYHWAPATPERMTGDEHPANKAS